MRPSPATPTFMAWPRPSRAMAPMCWTSSHAVVQRPQRMHASRSSTKNDLLASTGWWCRAGYVGFERAVAGRRRRRAGRSRSRSSPGVSIESVRSSTPVRTRTASGCWVSTTIPSRAGRWQAAGTPRMPSTCTRQVRQAPRGGRSGSLQSCGSGRPRRLTRVEDGGARRHLHGAAVDGEAERGRRRHRQRGRHGRSSGGRLTGQRGKLLGELREPRQQSVGRSLAQSAQRGELDHLGQGLHAPEAIALAWGESAERPAWRAAAPSPRDTACTCRTTRAH